MIQQILLLSIGLIVGVVSSMLGVGGGIILVPILVLLMNFEMHHAIGTSLVVIVLTALIGALTHYKLGNVNVEIAVIIAIGAVAGAVLGAHVAEALPASYLEKIFGVVLLIIAIKMLLGK